MMNRIKDKNYVFVALLALNVFGTFLFFHKGSDIRAHTVFFLKNGYPINFLYFFLIDLFSFFSREINYLLIASVIILSFAVMLKYSFTKKLVSVFNDEEIYKDNNRERLIAFLSVIIFSIPSLQFFAWSKFYSGQIVPNVWHNSTTITLFPLAIFITYYTIKLFDKEISWFEIFKLTLLLIISILIKPSFVFIYYPTIVLLIFQKQLNFRFVLPIIFSVIFLIVQFYVIFVLNKGLEGFNEKSGISIGFITSWKSQLRNYSFMTIPAFLMSLAFPIYYLKNNFARLLTQKKFQFVLIMFLIGLFIFLFIEESGPRTTHGNFGWQLIIATNMLFVYLMNDFYKKSDSLIPIKSDSKQTIITKLLVLLHVFSGIVYLILIMFLGKYK